MANNTIDRIGQVNKANAVDALFLTQFGGEIFGIFQDATVAAPMHINRNISGGKTAQFPAYGRVAAAYHTPGVELVGQTVFHAERTISVDDQLVADITLSEIDDLMNHYDVRGPFASELAFALANQGDKNVLQTAINAARASSITTGGSNGLAITSTNSDTVVADLKTAMYTTTQNFDEKNIPTEGRNMFIKPAQWYLLGADTGVQNRDYSTTPGDQATGQPSPEVAGLKLIKTNNIPTTTINSGPTAYQGVFGTTVAVATHASALGTVKLMDLTPEVTWDSRRLSWLITARFAQGHGILRPESAVEIKTS
tara:strand:- start:2013 stop:2945 length:933 start_codon:yes stop_codon:yes gene_type:complete